MEVLITTDNDDLVAQGRSIMSECRWMDSVLVCKHYLPESIAVKLL